jgi:ATP synthase protein I
MWRLALVTSAVGIEIAAAIAIGGGGGYYLDKKFGTAPWIMYVGLIAGIGAAIKALVRVSRAYRRQDEGAGGNAGGSEGSQAGKGGGGAGAN